MPIRLHFGDVPVAGESQCGAGIAQTPECPSVFPTPRPDSLGPLPSNIRSAMARLHTSGHTECFEPRDVPFRQTLIVHDLVAGIARTVCLAWGFIGIEGRA